MWRERGLTMVLVTHDSSIARRAQRIRVTKNGRLGFRQPHQDKPPGSRRPTSPPSNDADLQDDVGNRTPPSRDRPVREPLQLWGGPRPPGGAADASRPSPARPRRRPGPGPRIFGVQRAGS